MSQATFDKKFGADLLPELSTGPGVYLFRDSKEVVIYVGKAKNLRRRLQSYRNASRKKAHRKMVRIVKEACSVSFEELESEQKALLRENELIQELRPKHNVDGAYAFLYPAIGVGSDERHTYICFTTQPEEYREFDLKWYGTFRSRPRAKLAFDALVELLSLIGHLERKPGRPPHPRLRGSRFVRLRQLHPDLIEGLPWFLAGKEDSFLGELARLLLSKPRARRDASEVQERLRELKEFYEKDAVRLQKALRKLGRPGSFVHQEERDALFILAETPQSGIRA